MGSMSAFCFLWFAMFWGVWLSGHAVLAQQVIDGQAIEEIAQKSAAQATKSGQQDKDVRGTFAWSAEDSQADDIWEFKDPAGWKFAGSGDQRVLSQHLKASKYSPPHRSPTHMALVKERKFGSFQLDCQVKSTHPDYGHRDVCLFFGFEGPDRFYYLHMAKAMDPHANQLFIVNQADRKKISLTTTQGTAWDEGWHHVRIQRNVETGEIRVYFDDMEDPIMTAKDQSFSSGQIGLGSFDDTADFKSLTVGPLPASK